MKPTSTSLIPPMDDPDPWSRRCRFYERSPVSDRWPRAHVSLIYATLSSFLFLGGVFSVKSPIAAPQPGEQPPADAWSHRVLGDQNFWTARGVLAWWYQHAAPPDPPPGATFEQRDLVRRGRI